jgi:hypothetical protein
MYFRLNLLIYRFAKIFVEKTNSQTNEKCPPPPHRRPGKGIGPSRSVPRTPSLARLAAERDTPLRTGRLTTLLVPPWEGGREEEGGPGEAGERGGGGSHGRRAGTAGDEDEREEPCAREGASDRASMAGSSISTGLSSRPSSSGARRR